MAIESLKPRADEQGHSEPIRRMSSSPVQNSDVAASPAHLPATGAPPSAEIDHALRAAQANANTISAELGSTGGPATAKTVFVAPSPHGEGTLSAAGAALSEVDQALSQDIENLLQGEFEPIDAVLDGDALRQADAAAMSASPTATPIIATAPAATTVPAAPTQSHQPPPSAAASKPVLEAAKSAPASAAPQTATSPSAVHTEKSSSPNKKSSSTDRESETAKDSSETPPRKRRRLFIMPSPRAALDRLAQPIVPVLALINFPLRFVPRGMRSMVDWIAISMMVWVPIVWIMVCASGSADRAATAAVAKGSEGEKASAKVHEESKHEAKTEKKTEKKPEKKSEKKPEKTESHGAKKAEGSHGKSESHGKSH